MDYNCKGKQTWQVIKDLENMPKDAKITLIKWNGNTTTTTVTKHLEEMRELASEERAMRR